MGKFIEKQQKFIAESDKAILRKVEGRLEKALELKEQGEDDACEQVMEDMRLWLENKIEQLEQEQKRDIIENWDRSVFPKVGEQLVEGNRVLLQVLREEEKEQYLAVKYEYSPLKRAYKDEEFREEVWNDFISESAFVCSIYEKDSNEFVGYCSIKDLSKKEWELAIELKSDKCHKGYGTEALNLFMQAVHKLTGRRFFRVRVEIDNHASQGLMKKLGAYPNGISEFWLHGEEIERFQEEYKYMITDEIRNVAEEFCMDAEDILGYVLEYRFDMGKGKKV